MVNRKHLAYWLLLLVGLSAVSSCTNILGIETDYIDNPCASGQSLEPLECGEGACRVFVDACDADGLPVTQCAPGNPQPADTCGDALDNDCDGSVDEDDSGDCKCIAEGEGAATQKVCYTGAPSTRNKGLCHDGLQNCVNSTWGQCQNDVLPAIEKPDGYDNDCDGEVDEGLPCEEGEQQYCYGGPVADPTKPLPQPCKGGTQTCLGGQWGKCINQVLPVIEICDNVDNDCDGNTDDLGEVGSPCSCATGQKQPCYFDDAGNEIDCPPDLKGICACGTRTCTNGQFGTCKDAVLPAPQDVCDGQNDDDCNGIIDNVGSPGSPCLCVNGTEQDCYDGPPGTAGQGTCIPGKQACVNGQFKTCTGQKIPTVEICNGLDDDCNGQKDDGVSGVGEVCFLPQYAGTPCHAGTKKCEIGDTTPKCVPNVQPNTLAEDCDGTDDDCNGVTDDGQFCCTNNNDNSQNGNETDINCGGSCAEKCADGKKCKVGIDCESGNCVGSICISPTCNDGFKNGFEADKDCGVVCPTKCKVGDSCGTNSDCVTDLCNQATKICTQKELGESCGKTAECASGYCVDGVCCNEACNGACQACTNALKGGGANGFCGSVSDNTDPDNDCATNLPATCKSTGVCIGGSCANYPAGTTCEPASCSGPATENQADICDGNGACLEKVEKDCTPYACVGSACKTACVADGECATGYYCNAPQCQLKRTNGQSCALASQCQSGNCVDGVCCNDACGGTCLACNVSGSLGTCTTIATNQDPANECPNGSCDGLGQCQKIIGSSCTVNAQCASGNCVDGVCCNTSCLGTCLACDLAGTLGTCSPIPANGDPANECPNGACAGNGTCQGTVSTPCTMPSQCANNICVDGFCCDTPCSGLCEACSAALKGSGVDGVCGPIGSNLDPSNECAAGECNGAKACEAPDGTACMTGAQCQSGHCVDGVCCNTDCSGTCRACNVPNSVGTCANVPLNQDPANECNPGACDGLGACQIITGNPCSSNAQCSTGFCVDGVCCNSACTGTCQACSSALKGGGNNGECGPIAAATDPQNECVQEPAATCGNTGFCSGQGTCSLYANGTTCAVASCSGQSTKANPDTCNGVGQCIDGGTQSCNAYACNGGNCNLTCTSDTDCATGNFCKGMACEPKKANGLMCSSANECTSGNCVDGVCCSSACTDECKSCALPSSLGVCANIPSGMPDTQPACSGIQVCNGSGKCVDANGQPCATNAECFSTFCVDGFCCNTACTGLCSACSAAKSSGANGTCSPITSGLDPDNECSGAAACNGMGACGLLGDGSACSMGNECQSGFCVDNVCCNSACGGTCKACSAAKTNGVNGVCANVATNSDPDNECAAECNAFGDCEEPNGSACAANGECQSGICVDGVCCNSACNGDCQTCNKAGSVGTCAAVVAGQQDTCGAGATCDATGVCKKVNGTGCTLNAECLTGFCVDNVCCENACSGTCKTCNLGASPGICSNVPTNTDPANECNGADVCNGSGACVKVNGSSCGGNGECLSGFCTDGYCCESTCSGTCKACNVAGSLGMCANVPFGVDPANECAGAAVCDGAGGCKKGLGDACAMNTDCASNFCVDGVCCNAACDATCVACSAALTNGTDGTCAPVKANAETANECPTGECNGAGACEVANGTVCTLDSQCASSHCVDGVCCDTACSGTCFACTAALTNGTDGTCAPVKANAETGNECPNGECNGAGACEVGLGTSCTLDAQCASGFCADGVCCNSACTGTCLACTAALTNGTDGTCAPVKAGSETGNECPTGACNGAGACQVALGASCSQNAECASGSCADNVCCNAACTGLCVACTAILTGGMDGSCDPVKANLETGNECAIGECNGAGACEADLGASCSLDAQCASGFCADGVCCNGACGGGCESCNQGGMLGLCVPHSADTDPENTCTTECNGAGVCEVADGEACDTDADCSSGFCNPSTMLCAAPDCSDTFANGDETDIDCGGTCPTACDPGENCIMPLDCTSKVCTNNTCAAPTCTDGVMNGDETGIDCGNLTCGSCFLILVAGTNNADPYVGTFDASASSPSWTTASQSGPRMTTAPGAAMNGSGNGLVVLRDSGNSGEYKFARWNGSTWTTIADVDGNTSSANAIDGSPVAAGVPGLNAFVTAYRQGIVLQSRQHNATLGTWAGGVNILTLLNSDAKVQPDLTFRGANPYAVYIDNTTPQLFYSENSGGWGSKTSLDTTAVLGAAPPEVVTMSTGAVLAVFFKNTPVTNALHSRISTVAGSWSTANGSVTVNTGGSTAYRPSLVALPNNKAALVWRDGASNNVLLSIYDGATNTWSGTAINISGAAIDGAPSVARGRGGKLVEVLYTLNANPKQLTHARYDGTSVSTSAVTGVQGREQIAIAAPPL
ncbi:MopE-related protein [Polyangium sp. y55x31]|uniref:MopE-related protein n=1 Tax=Polyangium sp. y55x31 TaxID=3042688 RepID=UPI002482DC90|nr:MopE-related protein [Polyangium sp. y55x31]MDI1483685.1 MopE-related protein [Polyangium sp. y55x31]